MLFDPLILYDSFKTENFDKKKKKLNKEHYLGDKNVQQQSNKIK